VKTLRLTPNFPASEPRIEFSQPAHGDTAWKLTGYHVTDMRKTLPLPLATVWAPWNINPHLEWKKFVTWSRITRGRCFFRNSHQIDMIQSAVSEAIFFAPDTIISDCTPRRMGWLPLLEDQKFPKCLDSTSW